MSSNIKFVVNNTNCAFLSGFIESYVEKSRDGLNGECIVHYSGQYRNYTMTVELINGVREGKAVIVNGSVPYLRLEYKGGSLTGVVERMNSSGSIELRGRLENGIENGIFEEFDNNKVVWRGYYLNGKRNRKVEESTNLVTVGRSGGLSSSSGYHQSVSTSIVIPSSLTCSPLAIEVLKINNNSYNDLYITVFNLSRLVRLKRIVIGYECFTSVRYFYLDELNELESAVIGYNCFSNPEIDDDFWNHTVRTDGICRIGDCPKLKSIQIGDQIFLDYHLFELYNIPSLQSIIIGYGCFYWIPSFSLTGIIH